MRAGCPHRCALACWRREAPGPCVPQAQWNLSLGPVLPPHLPLPPIPPDGEASPGRASSRRLVGAQAGGREKVRAGPGIGPSSHGASVSLRRARLRGPGCGPGLLLGGGGGGAFSAGLWAGVGVVCVFVVLVSGGSVAGGSLGALDFWLAFFLSLVSALTSPGSWLCLGRMLVDSRLLLQNISRHFFCHSLELLKQLLK